MKTYMLTAIAVAGIVVAALMSPAAQAAGRQGQTALFRPDRSGGNRPIGLKKHYS